MSQLEMPMCIHNYARPKIANKLDNHVVWRLCDYKFQFSYLPLMDQSSQLKITFGSQLLKFIQHWNGGGGGVRRNSWYTWGNPWSAIDFPFMSYVNYDNGHCSSYHPDIFRRHWHRYRSNWRILSGGTGTASNWTGAITAGTKVFIWWLINEKS